MVNGELGVLLALQADHAAGLGFQGGAPVLEALGGEVGPDALVLQLQLRLGRAFVVLVRVVFTVRIILKEIIKSFVFFRLGFELFCLLRWAKEAAMGVLTTLPLGW